MRFLKNFCGDLSTKLGYMKMNKFQLSLLCSFLLVMLVYTGCSKKDTPIDNTTIPVCVTNASPANSSNVATSTVTLSWSAATGATSYDVYLGTSQNSTTKIASDVAGTSFSYALPSTNSTTYYWYVVPKNKKGSATGCQSSITSFNFSVIPGCALNTAPANNSFTTSNSITLTWTAITGATGYDVYLGTTQNPTTVVAANVSGTNYTYSVPKTAASTTYYWYVVPKSSGGSGVNCSSTVTSFTYAVIAPPSSLGFYVIGYFPSYRTVSDYPDRMFKMCNMVNYAFANVGPAGGLAISNPSVLIDVAAKAKANGAKVMLSISGAHADFLSTCSTPATRNTLVKNLIGAVRQYNLDGIDMDWEYPKTTDGTADTYVLMMQELSDSLHRDAKYYLTAAVTAGIYGSSGIKSEVFPYVDFLNIMAYDDFSAIAGENYRQHSSLSVYNRSRDHWLNIRALPAAKLVMGIPAYGRNSGAAQISTSYKTIINTGTALGPSDIYNSDSAMVAKTDGTLFKTYYNGMRTVKIKSKDAKDRNTAGIMFWEIGHDQGGQNNDYSLIKAACDTIGRSY